MRLIVDGRNHYCLRWLRRLLRLRAKAAPAVVFTVILDWSGSMNEDYKAVQALAIIAYLLGVLPPGSSAFVYMYNHSCWLERSFTAEELTADGIADLIASMRSKRPIGDTNTLLALKTVLGQPHLAAPGAEDTSVVVLFTDGADGESLARTRAKLEAIPSFVGPHCGFRHRLGVVGVGARAGGLTPHSVDLAPATDLSNMDQWAQFVGPLFALYHRLLSMLVVKLTRADGQVISVSCVVDGTVDGAVDGTAEDTAVCDMLDGPAPVVSVTVGAGAAAATVAIECVDALAPEDEAAAAAAAAIRRVTSAEADIERALALIGALPSPARERAAFELVFKLGGISAAAELASEAVLGALNTAEAAAELAARRAAVAAAAVEGSRSGPSTSFGVSAEEVVESYERLVRM